jgi:hypothetical protein
MCDKYQVLGNDLVNNCLGALNLRSETGVQKHCRLKRKAAKEVDNQISDRDH